MVIIHPGKMSYLSEELFIITEHRQIKYHQGKTNEEAQQSGNDLFAYQIEKPLRQTLIQKCLSWVMRTYAQRNGLI